MAVPTQDITNPHSLISLHYRYGIPFLSTVRNTPSIPHKTETPYIPYPYWPLRFENLHVILIYFMKCPIFSIIQSNAAIFGFTHVFIIFQ